MKGYGEKDKRHLWWGQGGNNCFHQTEEKTSEGGNKNAASGAQKVNDCITYASMWPQATMAYKEEQGKCKAAVKQLAHLLTCGWMTSYHCCMTRKQKTFCDYIIPSSYDQAKITTQSQRARVTKFNTEGTPLTHYQTVIGWETRSVSRLLLPRAVSHNKSTWSSHFLIN